MSDGLTDATADPAQLTERLSALSEGGLEDLLNGPTGGETLDEIFRQMRDHFQPGLAGGEHAVARFVITGRPGGGEDTYALTVRDGVCELATELPAATGPDVITVTIDRVRFVRVILGQTSNTKLAALYAARRIKIDGDLKLGGRVVSWFGVPHTE
jgi:hypothetical protein